MQLNRRIGLYFGARFRCGEFWRVRAERSKLELLFFGHLFRRRHSDIAPAADTQRAVGARVKPNPHFATALPQAKGNFGSLWNTTQISGIVLAVDIRTSKGKASMIMFRIRTKFSRPSTPTDISLASPHPKIRVEMQYYQMQLQWSSKHVSCSCARNILTHHCRINTPKRLRV